MIERHVRRQRLLPLQMHPPILAMCIALGLLGFIVCACSPSVQAPTPLPAPTMTPMPTFTALPTRTPTSALPTALPASPTPQATVTAQVTATAQPMITNTPAPTRLPATATMPAPTSTKAPPPSPTPLPMPTMPPRQGGDWDMEAGFFEWKSPYEQFTGHVANGWSPLIKANNASAAPRFNENKFPPNIQSGQRSQEISFDFRSGEMGLWRTAEVTPGNQYTVGAWAKYAPSPSGLSLFLGIDLTGGNQFEAETVTWYPWQNPAPNQWIVTRQSVRAASERMTVFLRAVHPVAEPGGNTMFDNGSLLDEGR